MTRVSGDLRKQVWQRAKGYCEYCLLAEEWAFFSHEPDHIIAEKHDGSTSFDNLALSCFDCNSFKGSNIASIDPESGQLTFLFNPRKQVWSEHFGTSGGKIIPLSAIGRVTERILKLNMPARIEVREVLARAGHYPKSVR